MRRYLVLLAVMLLAGCSAFKKDKVEFSCPTTGYVEHDASIAVLDAKGAIVTEGSFQGFSGTCSIDKEAHAVVLDLTTPFAARRSPAGADRKNVVLPYFIAVLSPDEQILQRQSFSTAIDFDNTGNGKSSEEHIVKIPLTSPAEAYKYKVLMGFALSPAQLAYNKDNKEHK